jgi:hypothetical protein
VLTVLTRNVIHSTVHKVVHKLGRSPGLSRMARKQQEARQA